ncbi:MAG: ABC transporter permease subunit, partial [Lentilitoribacter sp.]
MSSQQTNSDPWAQTENTTSDPWSQTNQVADDPWAQGSDSANSQANNWLNSESVTQPDFDPLHPFQEAVVPFGHWVESSLSWLVEYGRPLFQAIRVPIDFILSSFETTLVSTPAPIMLFILFLLAWQFSNIRLGLATIASLVFIGLIGAWSQAMTTLSLVLTSVFFCLLIGLPVGIWLARSPTAAKFVRPILDAMQTTPAFVYLVPIVMLFGIGNVPGVVVTIIFALPPVIRLTILGIQQVPEE